MILWRTDIMSGFVKGKSILYLFYNIRRVGEEMGSYDYRLYKNGKGCSKKRQIECYITVEHSLIWYFRLLHSIDLSIVCMNSFF